MEINSLKVVKIFLIILCKRFMHVKFFIDCIIVVFQKFWSILDVQD